VLVDPGRAFGTGGHATTRLSLELLIELEAAGEAKGPLADWGTGSGVLAIAAAKLGWGPITACDREAASLEAVEANARANGVELAVEQVDVREGPLPAAPTVVANLTANLLVECSERLAESGAAPATLACSGMLVEEADEVAKAFEPHGLREAARRGDGEWAALLLRAG
jgi:ribosomal protein L11 methyltransferase